MEQGSRRARAWPARALRNVDGSPAAGRALRRLHPTAQRTQDDRPGCRPAARHAAQRRSQRRQRARPPRPMWGGPPSRVAARPRTGP